MVKNGSTSSQLLDSPTPTTHPPICEPPKYEGTVVPNIERLRAKFCQLQNYVSNISLLQFHEYCTGSVIVCCRLGWNAMCLNSILSSYSFLEEIKWAWMDSVDVSSTYILMQYYDMCSRYKQFTSSHQCVLFCRYSRALTDSFGIKAIHAWTWPKAQLRPDTINDHSTWTTAQRTQYTRGRTTVYYRRWRYAVDYTKWRRSASTTVLSRQFQIAMCDLLWLQSSVVNCSRFFCTISLESKI